MTWAAPAGMSAASTGRCEVPAGRPGAELRCWSSAADSPGRGWPTPADRPVSAPPQVQARPAGPLFPAGLSERAAGSAPTHPSRAARPNGAAQRCPATAPAVAGRPAAAGQSPALQQRDSWRSRAERAPHAQPGVCVGRTRRVVSATIPTSAWSAMGAWLAWAPPHGMLDRLCTSRPVRLLEDATPAPLRHHPHPRYKVAS